MVTQKFAYIVQGMRLSVASPSNWHNQRSINGMEGEAEPSHVVQTMLRNLWDSTPGAGSMQPVPNVKHSF